jgi:transcriptional regulator with PAS, ATPase and Fis domain
MINDNSTFSEYDQTESKAMQHLYERIDQVAEYDSSVLVLGESGVGKEVVVKRIHEKSPRMNGPFVRINCGAIPDNLMESEMFGYAKGAFAGATNQGKLGLIPLANQGTLFLDEIAELTMPFQGKLLRVLQERHFYPIGGVKPVTVDIRIITATNRNLRSLIDSGKFREELFYRLNVVPIEVPPLRERKEDIPGLIDFFLKHFDSKYSKGKAISTKAMEVLNQYDWPGNVRELKNMVERLLVTTHDQVIESRHIPIEIWESIEKKNNQMLPEKRTLKEQLDQYEYMIIKDAVRRNKTLLQISLELGMDVSTISRKCKKFNLRLDLGN